MGYLFLVLLVFTSLCFFSSSSPLHDHKLFLSDSTTSKTDTLQENSLGATGTHEHGISSIGDDSNERSGIVHSSKFAHGSVYGGARGGGATGAADPANGGGDEQGSGAVVPVVIAGAASNHHPNKHHNAGSHHANCIVLPTLVSTALVAFIVH